jgi:NDP-sugar pyrophosphorylase family protein
VNAFVLAGGLGTRLKPQFGDLPKPLAPVAGRPFLARPLEWLASHRIADVVICAGYGAGQLRDSLGDGSAFGVRLSWSEETEPLGTGGALRHAAAHVRGPALVLNGDTLAECDPWSLERARWETGSLGAVALFEVPDARSRGRVEMDGDRVARFVEKDDAFAGPAWVNGGVYAFSSLLWRHLPEGPSSLERDVLPALASEGRIAGLKSAGTFYDIGTPEEWARAESRFAS